MTVLEICLESARAARLAEEGGAHRVELCSDLSVGGLTPDEALLREVRAGCALPVLCMIRPRPGGFSYGEEEVLAMEAAIGRAVDGGADGVVVGALRRDGRIDVRAMERFVKAAGGRPVTFHRAFDETPDPEAGLQTLIELGVERLLTSGHAPTALEGVERLSALVERAGSELVVMPGGNVRASNVAEILRRTGAREVHSSVGGEREISVEAVRELVRSL